MADTGTPTTLAEYSIVSWVRRGLVSFVTGQPATNYASLPVALSVNGGSAPAPAVRLLGPGDITGLDARAVIRTDPRDAADAFEPNYLAMAELALPDLPWMFTPAGAVDGRLQPWICLVVVADVPGAALEMQASGIQVLRIDKPLDPRTELPDLKTIDAWAHAQVTGESISGAALNTALDGDSASTLSRLIAPRKLDANSGYIACIVPTYHAGVNAALGLAVDDADVAPAWDIATVTAPMVLPVYYSFRFRTGPGGDFASLARNIQPPAVKLEAGTRPMDIGSPEFGGPTAAGLTLGLQGALCTFDNKPATNQPQPWAAAAGVQTAYQEGLRNSLVPAAAPDPVVAPPTYGSAQTGATLPAANAAPLWLGELNLDPRTRVAASAGTQVVQQNQEALVASSWEQLGEINKANQMLRQAQLAREVSTSLNTRHLQAEPDDGVYLQVTAPLHSRVLVTLGDGKATLRGHIAASRVPAGAMSQAMRRLARPRGPIGRQLTSGPSQIVDRLNLLPSTATNALQVTAPLAAPRGMVTFESAAPDLPQYTIAKMSGPVLASAGGWKVSSGVLGTTVSENPVLTEAMLSVGAEPIGVAPGEPVKVAPVEPVKVTPVDPVEGGPVITGGPVKVLPPLVNWNSNPNLPEILKITSSTLPPPMVFPSDATDLATMQQQFRSAAAAVSGYLQVAPAADPDPPQLGGAAGLAAARGQLAAGILPADAIQARVGARIALGTGADPLQPIQTGPEFPEPPMYTALAALSPDWMLPGISTIPMDCAALLAPNAAFIESFMVGLNEALSRELLWRQYPTGLQSTYFQNFWGAVTGDVPPRPSPDIPPIHGFSATGHIGDHLTDRGSGTSLVLLIRASLFRRYPNAVVSAVQAQWSGMVRTLTNNPQVRQYPSFRGEIGADITFFGFDIEDPRGVDEPAANRPGWYFVIEQHLTEPRFGLEPDTTPDSPGTPEWNDLRWKDIPAAEFLNPSSAPTVSATREGVPWGQSSAAMGFILLRKPVRVALHALALLGPAAAAAFKTSIAGEGAAGA